MCGKGASSHLAVDYFLDLKWHRRLCICIRKSMTGPMYFTRFPRVFKDGVKLRPVLALFRTRF